MANFTPVSALIGGAMIGLSAALLMLFAGRIAGISGILGDLLLPGANFLVGLIAAPLGYAVLGLLGGFSLPLPTMPGWTSVVLGGLLVGFGVRMAGGCTSGHGVCGMARLSPRSITATVVFMAMAAIVVFIVRHSSGV